MYYMKSLSNLILEFLLQEFILFLLSMGIKYFPEGSFVINFQILKIEARENIPTAIGTFGDHRIKICLQPTSSGGIFI